MLVGLWRAWQVADPPFGGHGPFSGKLWRLKPAFLVGRLARGEKRLVPELNLSSLEVFLGAFRMTGISG
jgi:hypothetical protein